VAFNLADLFEVVVDAVPDRTAVVAGGTRVTYGALDERANRLANHLVAGGVGRGDHVGVCSYDRAEWLEAMFAAFKLRAVPINVNHRYVEEELAYLFDNADLVALVVEAGFRDRVDAVRPRVPALRTLVVIDDGYEEALAAAPPERPGGPRSADDRYVLYTGGTTGLPKGTIWRHEDIFFAALGGGDPLLDKGQLQDPDDLPGRIPEFPLVQLCAPPLMHVSASWGAFNAFFGGGKVVLLAPGRFDPVEAWEAVGRERVTALTVVGDAMARPLLDALAKEPDGFDVSSLFVFASGGAILSPAIKAEIGRLLPNVIIVDTFGSSETGVAGSRSSGADGAGARFTVDASTAVLDDELRPVAPGSGKVGRLARRGHVPLGYYKDEAKTKATFVEADGVRWVLPGDMATVDDDGTVVLLGRGSGSINTGGEKVFPEEVEAVLKGHPAIYDALVVGVPDDRWGERVAAVVQSRPGADVTLDDLQAHARSELAGYKVPRDVVLVDEIRRGPNGKPDYAWAKEHARAELTSSSRSPRRPG
jgi:acyl-CoA synthetase (AMP-forming)/AMP-acid ligase II